MQRFSSNSPFSYLLIAQKSNNLTVSQVNPTAELGMLLLGALTTINLSSNFTHQIEPTQ
ncbi:hypothetical protein [Nostoc sp. DedQUE09]|uniref:hypothetical protein n=1 Tax=Nostoc sp. DedQUE09 TaxID=3075394 RepID=UPI002AD51C0F|nr:hypothetical protein [Nostoc sp. DedQUE09]MDZ7952002.1 hypothetical protein [Nostoc sp. DedQUE09]